MFVCAHCMPLKDTGTNLTILTCPNENSPSKYKNVNPKEVIAQDSPEVALLQHGHSQT